MPDVDIDFFDRDGVLKLFKHTPATMIKDAKRIVDLGSFYLGIGGVLTFKNSNLDKTIEKISLNHLLLETDSPYLTPSPYRGKRNESKYIIEIAEKLSKVKNCSMSKIADITTNNAKELFRL